MRLKYAAALLLLSACAVGEDYQPPEISLPASWRALTGASPALVSDGASADTPTPKIGVWPDTPPEAKGIGWWEQFNDPLLNDLVDRAIRNNQDMNIAESRVREARANYISASADLLPTVGLNGQAKRGNEGILSQNKVINLYQTNFDASWELDIFGGNRRQKEAAFALSQAAEADQKNTLLSVIAEVARNYIDARNAQFQMIIAGRNSDAERELANLIAAQQAAGLISGSLAAGAEAQYQAAVARAPMLKAAYAASVNRLNTLIGSPPGTIDAWLDESKPIPHITSAVVLATPATSIALRPDVAAAERRLAAATAYKGAATAELFPKLTLSGLFGYQKNSLFPSTTLWSGASGLAMPLISFGKLQAGIDTADAQQLQAMATYQKTLLSGLEETETALSGYLGEQARVEKLTAAADNRRQAANFAGERYRRGIAAFTDVLIAQRDVFAAESTLADSQAMAAKNAVALYKALGGTTTPKEAAASVSPSPPAPAGMHDKAPDQPGPWHGPLLDSGIL